MKRSPTASNTTLPALWLRLARLLAFLLGVALSLLAIYNFAAIAKMVIQEPLLVIPEAPLWTANQLESALARLGLPGNFFAVYSLSVALVFSLSFLACGWLILLNKSRDWFGLFLALLLLGWANVESVFVSIPRAVSWMQILDPYLAWFVWPGLFLILYFFPSGHVTPRWARWFAWGLGLLAVYGLLVTILEIQLVDFIYALPLVVAILIVGGYAQVYRYRHAGALERQQIKWVVFAMVMLAAYFILFAALENFTGLGDPGQSGPPAALIYKICSSTIAQLTFIGIPVAMALSMLRYRLWDVDILIRRTLQYSLLTGLLALVYFGSVILLQGLFSVFGGQPSTAVIVLSTLGIAALFNPLRHRLQDLIDRRFYRKKYDAERALAQFAVTARGEVEYERLTTSLLSIVQATMQPERVWLWLAEEKPAAAANRSPDMR